MQTTRFASVESSADFYDERYASGYMDYWSEFEKAKLESVVKEMNLPSSGMMLDFGCGRGIFTSVLKRLLPGWEVYGCDISKNAVRFAAEHNPGIKFFVLGDVVHGDLRFDFIHSHHVLEHVFSIDDTVRQLTKFAAARCTMLHSLPCNHQGSLEYIISSRIRNGIDKKTGKFFFEDVAHQRRLDVNQASALFAPAGFSFQKAYYANQYHGAIQWIAASHLGMVMDISRLSGTVSAKAFLQQLGLRIRLFITWLSFFTAFAFEKGEKKSFFKKLIGIMLFPLCFWFALPVSSMVRKKARKEWEEKRNDKNGSDMYLVVSR